MPLTEHRHNIQHAQSSPPKQGQKGLGLKPPAQMKNTTGENELLGESDSENIPSFLSTVQRKSETINGITAEENSAVNQLTGGQVDLHSSGSKVENTSPNDSRLKDVGARSMAVGGDALIGDQRDRGHEIWHLAQQHMGMVKPTTTVNNQPVNDDPSLEKEADDMGAKIMQGKWEAPVQAREDTNGQKAVPFTSLKELSSTQRKTTTIQAFSWNRIAQFNITDEKMIAVPDKQQQKTNSCWAASGWSIYEHVNGGGTYSTEAEFVNGQAGSAATKGIYTRNLKTDIDKIIGSGSNENLLAGSDVENPFSKSSISRALNADKPIVANVNASHYVVICGKRKNNGVYELQVMDPDTGSKSWMATNSGTKVDTMGAYSLSVLYYTA